MSTSHTSQFKARTKLTGPIGVGKDILEVLSSAMYVDPLSIYREYIQNAVDSLDALAAADVRCSSPSIEITLNAAERRVAIRDYGTGVPKRAFARTLTAIGGSKKRGTAARGFRGVGRLAGLGYCQALTMRSKTLADTEVTAMHWDCARLKELLRDPVELTLDQILEQAVEISTEPAAKGLEHFFEIELHKVARLRNDVLLNQKLLENYLSQVAPVPFSPDFSFGKQIQEFLLKHNVGTAYSVSINGRPVYRPHRDRYEAKPKVEGKFLDIEFFEVPGLSSGNDAVGWILHSDYLGAIPERHGIQSLRVRAGNIQVGDARLLDPLFPQTRFNSWSVGECHIISNKIIPNARRDDFEQNPHYNNLLTHLTSHATTILKACRARSAERTRSKAQVAQTHSAVDWVKTKSFLTKHGQDKLNKSHKEILGKKLQNGGITYLELLTLFTEPAGQTPVEKAARRT